jgi:deazaflavin-dependent oxidoreductase (nitroreductase family)
MTQQHVFSGATTPRLNRALMWLLRRGVPVAGARVMTVRGRSTGQPRHTPVNPVTVDGGLYLVAPRGHVQWTRNLRAAGEVELRRGRTVRRYTATEVPEQDRPAVLRAYYRRFKAEVARYFAGDGITADSTEADWRAVAGNYPVFRLAERP